MRISHCAIEAYASVYTPALQCDAEHCHCATFVLLFEVRGREPALAHRTESASSWPGSTGGRDEQPNLSALSLPRKRGECPSGESNGADLYRGKLKMVYATTQHSMTSGCARSRQALAPACVSAIVTSHFCEIRQ